MFVLEKTSDVHGEGLMVSACDVSAVNHSSLPELRSQAELDWVGVSSTQSSVFSLVLQRLNKMRFFLSCVCRGRVQISLSNCSIACDW